MSEKQVALAKYGNWVSTRIIIAPLAIAVVLAVLCIFTLYLLIPTAIFLMIAAYFGYARYLFSPTGKNIQQQITALVPNNLDWESDGTLLDIGCGAGGLTIDLAKQHPSARLVGTDYWGGNWEYSKKACEASAAQRGVGGRIIFKRSSASSLPFKDGEFDAVVSNLVFHEVKDTRNKIDLVKEALRVLRKGGTFVLQDLFLIERMYGTPQSLLATIRSWGIQKVEFIETRTSPFIPRALKLPFMVGTIAMIKGEK